MVLRSYNCVGSGIHPKLRHLDCAGLSIGCELSHSKAQINTGSVPTGIVVTDTQTPGVMVSTGSFGGETELITGYNLQTVHTSSVAVIPAGFNSLSYEQNWVESLGLELPEPTSSS